MHSVFIYGAPKTGTTLLCNLLDGSSDLFVYHNEIKYKFYACYKFKGKNHIKYSYLFKNKDSLKYLFSNNPEKARIANKHIDFTENDVKTYKESLIDYLSKSNITGHNLVIKDLSLIASIFKKKNVSRVCFKDVGGNFDKTIKTYFKSDPQGKMILLLRNPYAQFLSRINYWKKGNIRFNILNKIEAILRLNYFFYVIRHTDCSNILIVNYEEIVLNTKNTILNICEYLSLSFNDTMLHPTFNGKSAVVQTSTQSNSHVFSDSLDLWKSNLCTFDKLLVKYLCPNATFFNYDTSNIFNFKIFNSYLFITIIYIINKLISKC